MDDTFYQAVLHSLDEQLAIVDQTGTIVFVNDSWQRFGESNGLAPGYRWTGTNYLNVCNAAGNRGDDGAERVAAGLSAVFSGREPVFHHEYPCHSPNEKRWFILRAGPVHGYAGRYFAVTHQNITRRKLAEESAEYSALHDPLTGLSNRRHFDAFLADTWRRARRAHGPTCLLMLDLDHFKAYNDEKGHLGGDACLRSVAGVLSTHASRDTDLSARFGGDEFALILADTAPDGAVVVAGKIMEGIRALGLGITCGDAVSTSIGMACRVPDKAADCADETALVALADTALYRAKSNGRNRIESV